MKSKESITYELRFSEISEREIEDAILYFENKSILTLKKFKEQLNLIFDHLENNPFFQIRYKNIRAIPFKT